MALFSVLLTNYNNSHSIDEAIRSVLEQSLTDWELIIIDDASIDDSVQRLQKYLNDPRIHLYVRVQNEGYTRAQIFGLKQVSSEIVGILDSDDALLPTALEKVYAAHLAYPEAGLILTQMILSDSNLQPIYKTVNTPEHLLEPLLWLRGPTHFRTFKMNAYKRMPPLDPSLLISSDWDLLFKMEETAPWLRIDEPLIRYRNSSSSLAHGGNRFHQGHMEGTLVVYNAYLRRRGGTIPNLPKTAVLGRLIAAIQHALEINDFYAALRFALRSLRITPFQAASYRGLTLALIQLLPRRLQQHKTKTNDPDSNPTPVRRLFPIRQFQIGTGNLEPDRLVCIPLVHQKGHCLFGGDITLQQEGHYKAFFSMKIKPYSFAQSPLIVVDIYENLHTGKVLSEWPIEIADIQNGLSEYQLKFTAQEGHRVEFRVFWAEQCYLTIDKVMLEYLGASQSQGNR